MTIDLSDMAQQLVDEQLARGKYSSPAEVVEEALRVLAEREDREETLQAIREGIADSEAGRVSSVDEVFDRIREKHPHLF